MKVVLFCDRESGTLGEGLKEILDKGGHTAQIVALNRDEIKPCLGCFGCWLKTPGKCVITSDAENTFAQMEMSADVIVLLSRITFGGFSADCKAFLDRSIQNILPFFEIYEGEMHHVMRYERFPIWIALGHGEASEGEKQTFMKLAQRNALNMHPPKYQVLIMKEDSDISEIGTSILQELEEKS